jgi:hypothetical protein
VSSKKWSIYKEEWWPVLEPVPPNKHDPICEIPDDLMLRYNETLEAFNAVQEELWTIFREVSPDE